MMPSTLERICSHANACRRDVLDDVLTLARQIAEEPREGRRCGAVFTIGRAADVLNRSRPLILDPLAGHPAAVRHISSADVRGTIKALAQLDGAFVVDEDGTVVAGCRYLDAPAAGVEVPLGLGSRHFAAASMSRQLGIIVVVVSESGTVRAFFEGKAVQL